MKTKTTLHQREGLSRCMKFLLISAFSLLTLSVFAQTTLVSAGSSWKYLDNNTSPTNWQTSSFNDAAWNSGNAPLGYEVITGATLNTTLSYGTNANAKYITTYFRTTFSTTSSFNSLNLNLLCDDGAVIYLNGTEVYRYNMPTGSITQSTYASTAIGNADEGDYTTYNVSASALVSGTNVLAVEVHQAAANSSDLGFDLSVAGVTGTTNYTLINGPYLQMATPTSITVRYRTGQSITPKVFYGTSASSLTNSVSGTSSGTEHVVALSSLSPNTKYFYAVGTSNNDIIQSGSNNFFITPPTVGTEKATRIWVLGDCGSASTTQSQNRDQYYAYDNKYTDAVLLLGDNAYNSGTDAEFQVNFFNYYDDQILRQSPLWPVPGNHDYSNGSAARQDDKNIPYYDLFTLPTNGEAGGVASGTEAFYSYDLANIHFLALDSYGEENNKRMSDTTGAQATWVKQDLAATNQTWKIAYWHHPPYTMGSHNSDSESELIAVRNQFLRMMERYDVDLILTGHSHQYERTKMIDGHYGNESSYSASTHEVSSSSGRYNGTSNSCPYTKEEDDHSGTVFVVAGSAGRATSTQGAWPHNSSYSAYNVAGTFILDVEGNTLKAKFLGYDGVVRDSFTMMKDVNKTTEISVDSGSTAELTASWVGSQAWSTGASTRTITVNSDTNMYVVNDGKGCLSDTFIINSGNAIAPTCTDGVKNGSETGVDCGGPDCNSCPTCNDGIKNGDETGVDCGGSNCNACPSCSDGIKNGSETGVDCGGPDCGACPTCNDGIKNGDEVGVDCGGSNCYACTGCTETVINFNNFESNLGIWVDGGGNCTLRSNSTYSNGAKSVELKGSGSTAVMTTGNLNLSAYDNMSVTFSYLTIGMSTSSDGFILQMSTNGGSSYTNVKSYQYNTDFTNSSRKNDSISISGTFTSTTKFRFQCSASSTKKYVYIDDVKIGNCEPTGPTCSDGIKNAAETGVDCGGPDCDACPTCSDGIQNGDEDGVDCGGTNCSACLTCTDGIKNRDETDVDCGGTYCDACPTCYDGVKNGDETGVDCGGSSCTACSCTNTLVNFNNFESSLGIWVDGGSDCALKADANYSNGSKSVQIKGNSSSAVMTTPNLDLSQFEDLSINFSFETKAVKQTTEGFYLQISYNGGSTYSTLKTWLYGADFSNDTRVYDTISLQGSFTSTTKIRFKANGASTKSLFYIDDVRIQGCENASTGAFPAQEEEKPVVTLLENNGLAVAKFYPNPANQYLNIRFDEVATTELDFRMYDLLGRTLKEGKLEAGQNTYKLNINEIPNGLFIIQISNKMNQSSTYQIWKQ